ncbi:hypothetical protein ACFC36_19555 [Streptomyces rubiginosohelvolus]|uniref:competence protein CoiA family protein n=1 Tax=Streptomyces rubiginosohelvolus TaxID=67362 RepID=UPI0035D9B881
MANGVWHGVLQRVIELDKENLGIPRDAGIDVDEVRTGLLQPVARRQRDLLVCVERALGRTCKAELKGVKSPHMYVRAHRGPDGALRLRAAHLPTVHEMTPEESDRHKAMKEFLARTCQEAGLDATAEKATKNRSARPDVTVLAAGGVSLGCEAQFYNPSPSTVLRRTRAHDEDGLVTNWITHDDTFHLVDRAHWMLIRDVTWREINNAADLSLVGGYRVLASWHCTAAANRPCPAGKAKTGCGKRHLQWDTPAMSDGEATGWSARGDRLTVTVGQTLVGAATGSVTPLLIPGRQDQRTGRYLWVPATDRETWAGYQASLAPVEEDEPEAEQDDEVHYSGHDADDTCRFGETTWTPSATLPRRGISSIALSLTVDESLLPAVPRQRTTATQSPPRSPEPAVRPVPVQRSVDWSTPDRFLSEPQPCRHCDKPASLLDDTGAPCHKVCAEGHLAGAEGAGPGS